MSDFEKKKFSSKSKLYSTNRDSSAQSTGSGRSFFSSKNSKENKDTANSADQLKIKQPTILLKVRDHAVEESSSNVKRSQNKESENVSIQKEIDAPFALKHMKKSQKLIDEGIICTDHLQEFTLENSDFLVIGVVGPHGVGKSTLMNLLAHTKITEDIKKSLFRTDKDHNDSDLENNGIKILTENLENLTIDSNHEIFKVQTVEHVETNCNATQGVDVFITSNRTILLDCQPFNSVSVLDDLVESENKRTNLVSEFIPLENSGEIQSLQLTAFLMSVCHVLLLVQDWFFDSNVIRFIHTAEMLKPTTSNPEDEYTEHFPHLVLIHNKAVMEDFTPSKFKLMQKVYRSVFSKTKLQLYTNLGIGFGRIINTLNAETCGTPINLYLIPDASDKDEIYSGHPPLNDLIKRLRANLLGATKNPLTHVQLTEKTWLLYCAKVWDTVKKSPFFVEYTKLMP